MACTEAITPDLQGLLDPTAGRDPVESQALQEGTVSLGVQVYPASREREVLLERKGNEECQELDRRDQEDLLAHQEKAGQDLQALQALPGLAVPLDVKDTLESVGLLDLLGSVTLLCVLVFLTTGRDTANFHLNPTAE